MLVRACKALLVGVVALLMTLIVLGNVMNYDANWLFVRHVLAMDSIFPHSRLAWRAITNPAIASAAYLSIIIWEGLCAVTTGTAALLLAVNADSNEQFTAIIPLACAGITMVLVLFGAGFLAIGGEWFLMWQSAKWNGLESASRYFVVAGLTLLIILSPEGNGATNGQVSG
jgi:predicted small integral membrane protein